MSHSLSHMLKCRGRGRMLLLSCIRGSNIFEGCHRRLFLSTTASCNTKSASTPLLQQIKAKIKMNGPITVSDYMQEVLTNPVAGYYMLRDVFGTQGDFITSPEISQMFGELIGVWCVNEWMQSGSPADVQVVELGPGRGTLAEDMLRVFNQFEGMKTVPLHLVEVSPKLSKMQREKLTESTEAADGDLSRSLADAAQPVEDSDKAYKRCRSKYGSDVRWYRQLSDVPDKFTLLVAHEFFDALPVHKFQKKNDAWREIMVDIDEDPETPNHLRFVLSYNPTAASKILLEIQPGDNREHVELCPEGGILMQQISERISHSGGSALIADYGHNGEKADTFRAFKQHKLHDPLNEPGTADLTADVDFAYLRRMAGNSIASYGPVTQDSFLHNMGIGVRLQVLMLKASPDERESLISGYKMLTGSDQMGERFKFFSLRQHGDPDYVPAGFASP